MENKATSSLFSRIKKSVAPTREERLEKVYDNLTNDFVDNHLYKYQNHISYGKSEAISFYGTYIDPFLHVQTGELPTSENVKEALSYALHNEHIDPHNVLSDLPAEKHLEYKNQLVKLGIAPYSVEINTAPNPYLVGYLQAEARDKEAAMKFVKADKLNWLVAEPVFNEPNQVSTDNMNKPLSVSFCMDSEKSREIKSSIPSEKLNALEGTMQLKTETPKNSLSWNSNLKEMFNSVKSSKLSQAGSMEL